MDREIQAQSAQPLEKRLRAALTLSVLVQGVAGMLPSNDAHAEALQKPAIQLADQEGSETGGVGARHFAYMPSVILNSELVRSDVLQPTRVIPTKTPTPEPSPTRVPDIANIGFNDTTLSIQKIVQKDASLDVAFGKIFNGGPNQIPGFTVQGKIPEGFKFSQENDDCLLLEGDPTMNEDDEFFCESKEVMPPYSEIEGPTLELDINTFPGLEKQTSFNAHLSSVLPDPSPENNTLKIEATLNKPSVELKDSARVKTIPDSLGISEKAIKDMGDPSIFEYLGTIDTPNGTSVAINYVDKETGETVCRFVKADGVVSMTGEVTDVDTEKCTTQIEYNNVSNPTNKYSGKELKYTPPGFDLIRLSGDASLTFDAPNVFADPNGGLKINMDYGLFASSAYIYNYQLEIRKTEVKVNKGPQSDDLSIQSIITLPLATNVFPIQLNEHPMRLELKTETSETNDSAIIYQLADKNDPNSWVEKIRIPIDKMENFHNRYAGESYLKPSLIIPKGMNIPGPISSTFLRDFNGLDESNARYRENFLKKKDGSFINPNLDVHFKLGDNVDYDPDAGIRFPEDVKLLIEGYTNSVTPMTWNDEYMQDGENTLLPPIKEAAKFMIDNGGQMLPTLLSGTSYKEGDRIVKGNRFDSAYIAGEYKDDRVNKILDVLDTNQVHNKTTSRVYPQLYWSAPNANPFIYEKPMCQRMGLNLDDGTQRFWNFYTQIEKLEERVLKDFKISHPEADKTKMEPARVEVPESEFSDVNLGPECTDLKSSKGIAKSVWGDSDLNSHITLGGHYIGGGKNSKLPNSERYQDVYNASKVIREGMILGIGSNTNMVAEDHDSAASLAGLEDFITRPVKNAAEFSKLTGSKMEMDVFMYQGEAERFKDWAINKNRMGHVAGPFNGPKEAIGMKLNSAQLKFMQYARGELDAETKKQVDPLSVHFNMSNNINTGDFSSDEMGLNHFATSRDLYNKVDREKPETDFGDDLND